jgi:hypothetical protein
MIDKNSTKEEVVQQEGDASEDLRNDRDVLMAEIKQNLKALLSIHGAALESMEQEVKND